MINTIRNIMQEKVKNGFINKKAPSVKFATNRRVNIVDENLEKEELENGTWGKTLYALRVGNKDKGSYRIEDQDNYNRKQTPAGRKVNIQTYKVKSSNLATVGYDKPSRTLEVSFKGGGVYLFYNVAELVFEGLLNAQSHGRYFWRNIRHRYKYRQIW